MVDLTRVFGQVADVTRQIFKPENVTCVLRKGNVTLTTLASGFDYQDVDRRATAQGKRYVELKIYPDPDDANLPAHLRACDSVVMANVAYKITDRFPPLDQTQEWSFELQRLAL